MINAIKEKKNKLVDVLITWVMNELKEVTNNQLTELKKTLQGMKGAISKATEYVEKNQEEILEMKTSVSQIKHSILCLQNVSFNIIILWTFSKTYHILGDKTSPNIYQKWK